MLGTRAEPILSGKAMESRVVLDVVHKLTLARPAVLELPLRQAVIELKAMYDCMRDSPLQMSARQVRDLQQHATRFLGAWKAR